MITLGLFAKVLFHTHPMQALFSIPMLWLWYAHLSQCLCVKQRICKRNYSNAFTCDEKLHKLKAYASFKFHENFVPFYTLQNPPLLLTHTLYVFWSQC
jgi:hypothetical protein